MNDRIGRRLIDKSCADCIPADMDCQISVECKRQRREKQRKEDNMAKEFFKGDKVWIYDSPCEPRLATIVCKMSQVEAYQVEYKEGREKLRVYGTHNIFEYPDGLNEMVCKMRDDAFYLTKMVKEFENNPIMWA